VEEPQIRDVYNGALPVIINRSDGWFRFSAGRFNSFESAVDRMKREEIYGFIVAFRGDQRFDVKEARRLIE
jgi:hypothetical protein